MNTNVAFAEVAYEKKIDEMMIAASIVPSNDNTNTGKKYRIEMRRESGWVQLGGVFGADVGATRMDQFCEHYMVSPNQASRTCKAEFRMVECDSKGVIL